MERFREIGKLPRRHRCDELYVDHIFAASIMCFLPLRNEGPGYILGGIALLGLILAAPPLPGAETPKLDTNQPLMLPWLPPGAIDAETAQWTRGHLAFRALSRWPVELDDAYDSPIVRLGWTSTGILFRIEVNDATPISSTNVFTSDRVDLFFGRTREERGHVQFVIRAPISDRPNSHEVHGYDHRRGAENSDYSVIAEFSSQRTSNGYLLEGLLPWSLLATTPAFEDECTFQVYVTDENQKRGSPVRYRLYPDYGTHRDGARTIRFRLASAGPTRYIDQALSYSFGNGVIHLRAFARDKEQVLQITHGATTAKLRMINGTGTVTLPLHLSGSHVEAVNALDAEGRGITIYPRDPLGEIKEWVGRLEYTIVSPGSEGSAPKISVFYPTVAPSETRFDPEALAARLGPFTMRHLAYGRDFSPVSLQHLTSDYAIVHKLTTTVGVFHHYGKLNLDDEDKSGGQKLVAVNPDSTPYDEQFWWQNLRQIHGLSAPSKFVTTLPPFYKEDSARRWPLILSFHPFRQYMGPQAKEDLLAAHELHRRAREERWPLIVASLITPENELINWPLLEKALQEVLREYPVDQTKVSLIASSNACLPTWKALQSNPKRFRAALLSVPVGLQREKAPPPNLPLKVFAGSRDPEGALSAAYLRRMNWPRIQLTIIQGASHGEADQHTFSHSEPLKWLVEQTTRER